jgi:hypothetical protein
MFTMNYLTKMIAWKVSFWTRSALIIAAVLVSPVVAVDNAVSLVVNVVTGTVEERITSSPLGAVFRYVENVHDTCHYQTRRLFHCVPVVIGNVPAQEDGRKSDIFSQNQTLIWRIGMGSQEYLSELEQLVIEGDKLQVWWGRDGRRIRYLYSKGICDAFIAQFIRDRVNGAKRQIAFSGCPFLPPRLYKGDFVFGLDSKGKKILTRVQYFNAHTLIVAGTGSGKTNISKYHAVQIAPKVRGLWLIDLRKAEYRALRPVFQRLGLDLKIVRVKRLKLNPLQVPGGVDAIDFASVIAESIVRALNLPPRASILVKTTIIRLYAKYGILSGCEEFPTLFHLFDAIKENKEANRPARQAVLDNLEAVLLALGPEVLAYHRGWNVHRLAQQHLVFEFAATAEAAKNLLLDCLLTSEFIYRIRRGISNPMMDLWIAFDEGQRLFSQKKESESYGGNSLIDSTGLVRGTGIGLEISVLTTVGLSHTLPNLTSQKIVGRCGSLSEYIAAGNFASLNKEQAVWAAHSLVPGAFIGQLGESNWRHPFVFRVPLLKNLDIPFVSNFEADKSADGISRQKVLPASI